MVIRMILLVTEELESGVWPALGVSNPGSSLTFQRLEGAQSFA